MPPPAEVVVAAAQSRHCIFNSGAHKSKPTPQTRFPAAILRQSVAFTSNLQKGARINIFTHREQQSRLAKKSCLWKKSELKPKLQTDATILSDCCCAYSDDRIHHCSAGTARGMIFSSRCCSQATRVWSQRRRFFFVASWSLMNEIVYVCNFYSSYACISGVGAKSCLMATFTDGFFTESFISTVGKSRVCRLVPRCGVIYCES